MKSFMAQHVDDVAALVERRPGATWGELQRLMRADGYDVDGEYSTGIEDMNLVFAVGLSPGLIDIVFSAHEAGRIHFHPMGYEEALLICGFEGDLIPDLPPAKRVPRGGYREPHWLPVVMYPGAGCCDCPAQ